VAIHGKEIGEPASKLTRYDSTIVTLSGKLLKVGYLLKGGDAAHVRQLKFTVGLSELPTVAQLFTEQKYTSENVALKEIILIHQPSKVNAIRIFDRGLSSRNTHDKFIREGIPFISRINPDSKKKALRENKLKENIETDTLIIQSDEWVYLYSANGRSEYPVRCIGATQKKSGEEIVFVTSIHDLSTVEITDLYKYRWDIEVFFKFLKQELNFSHLINRSENGIRVMLYATLIVAILLLVYKKKNKLSGFKIMKLKFQIELERDIVKTIVVMCHGDPDLFEKHFGKTPP
jgi:hypothetical protein